MKKTALLLIWFLASLPTELIYSTQPNVVVFLADDQGWGDLSASGNKNLVTPNIDSLARDGASLENFYVCRVCAPTRAEFLTGRYYPRTGVSGVSSGEGRLNYDETTVADLLKRAGYVTGCFGKCTMGHSLPITRITEASTNFMVLHPVTGVITSARRWITTENMFVATDLLSTTSPTMLWPLSKQISGDRSFAIYLTIRRTHR